MAEKETDLKDPATCLEPAPSLGLVCGVRLASAAVKAAEIGPMSSAISPTLLAHRDAVRLEGTDTVSVGTGEAEISGSGEEPSVLPPAMLTESSCLTGVWGALPEPELLLSDIGVCVIGGRSSSSSSYSESSPSGCTALRASVAAAAESRLPPVLEPRRLSWMGSSAPSSPLELALGRGLVRRGDGSPVAAAALEAVGAARLCRSEDEGAVRVRVPRPESF